MKPMLIDYLAHTTTNINCAWYIAKPWNYGDGFFERLQHTWWVLTGKARAVCFMEDINKSGGSDGR